MRFPHPKGNIPIRMRQRGQPGITIDRSTNTVSGTESVGEDGDDVVSRGDQSLGRRWQNVAQASLGTGSLPPGWEKGLTGSCVGERRSQSIFMMRLSKEFYNVKPRKYNLILVSCFRMLLLSPSMAFGEVGIFHKIPSNVSNQGQEDNHSKYQIIRSKGIEFWIYRRHLSWQLRFWRSSDRPVHQSSQGKAKIQIQSKIQWQT